MPSGPETLLAAILGLHGRDRAIIVQSAANDLRKNVMEPQLSSKPTNFIIPTDFLCYKGIF